MKSYRLYCLFMLCLSAMSMAQPTETAPQFADGNGYYSYKKPLTLPLPEEKILIHYFYQYDCEICLKGDDYLKAYAAHHPDKVVLTRSPSFANNSEFTARMHAALTEYGRPDLSDKYLFDSVGRKGKQHLVNDNDAIARWLRQNGIDPNSFHDLFTSDQVKQRMAQDRAIYQAYSPPVTPMAVLNGKYILVQDTLYNDDYTYAVLDFLVDKLQHEKQQTQENK